MPGFTSAMLADVFPELISCRGEQDAFASSTISEHGYANVLIYGRPLLDETLLQAWHGPGKIESEKCGQLLQLTLSRFEEVQRFVATKQAWDDSTSTASERNESGIGELPSDPDDYKPLTVRQPLNRQRCDLHALFLNSLPEQKLQEVISIVLCEFAKVMLEVPAQFQLSLKDERDQDLVPDDADLAIVILTRLVKRLCLVGLGGPLAERAYAVAADRLMASFVDVCFGDLDNYYQLVKMTKSPGQQKWPHLKQCPIKELEGAMVEIFCPVLHRFMCPLDSLEHNALGLDQGFIWQSSVEGVTRRTSQETRAKGQDKSLIMWCERARDRLRDIRSQQSYAIIISQDGHFRRYGLQDIRELSKDPYGRNLVAQGLERQIAKQLVRPGTSTVDVLETYMLIIATLSEPVFDGKRVDPSNILLTRSTWPVREFLKSREDAARIVLISLLEPRPLLGFEDEADARVPPPSTDFFSGRIAVAMHYHRGRHNDLGHYEGSDLLSMDWEPEPVDALSGHRFNTSLDEIGHITTIAPPETFVTELEHILGERLLKTDQLNFEAEMRLLRIFHTRFGESQIQACENMLNDMIESTKWNEKINAASHTPAEAQDFQAKIISQASWQELRWEQLQKEQFQLPQGMKDMIDKYEQHFAQLQDERHLEWVPQLGRVAVELELEDRTLTEEVTPLQAAVIYQFVDLATPSSSSSRTMQDIHEVLQGDEESIRAALQFWVSRLVLAVSPTETSETYTVLETVEPANKAAAAAVVAASTLGTSLKSIPGSGSGAGTAAVLRTRADLLADHAPTYMAYIVGMLTNQGAMELGRIHTLLKMLAPGGFAFDEDELTGLLEDMNTRGTVTRVGPLWRIS